MLPLLLIAAAYLIGSIPFSFLVVRAVAGRDIRQEGSGNVGATNVLRTTGKVPGIVALALDIVKGWGAVALAKWLVARPDWPWEYTHGAPLTETPSFWIASAAVLAVVGHIFPVWLKFRGGKGVATAAGVFLALDPRAIGAAMIVFIIVLIVTRYVSLASIIAAASLPLWIRFGAPPAAITIAAVVIALIVIAKHHTNLARLAQGTERKFPR